MRAITVRHIGQTNYRCTRVKASEPSGNSATVSYHAEDRPYEAAVRALCEKMRWTGKLVCGDVKEGRVYVFLPRDCELALTGRRIGDILDV